MCRSTRCRRLLLHGNPQTQSELQIHRTQQTIYVRARLRVNTCSLFTHLREIILPLFNLILCSSQLHSFNSEPFSACIITSAQSEQPEFYHTHSTKWPTMGASNDGSEDVDQFLARIASLSKKSEDDAEQARRAEEQMLQARKERQARRAGMRKAAPPTTCTDTEQSVLDPSHQ